jgi:hypothetical protein
MIEKWHTEMQDCYGVWRVYYGESLFFRWVNWKIPISLWGGTFVNFWDYYDSRDTLMWWNTWIRDTQAAIDYLYWRGIPVNPQPNDYTIVKHDQNKLILHPESDNVVRIYTIPTDAQLNLPLWATITFVNESQADLLVNTQATMYLAWSSFSGERTIKTNWMATAVKTSSDRWIISWIGTE